MVPNTCLNHRGTETTAGTGPRHIARVAQGADVPAALRAPGADHPPATAPTHQETPQQIWMLRVVALGPLPIADQLDLGAFPGVGVDKGWDPHGDPCRLGTPRAALAIARTAIFQPTQPIRSSEIPRLRAIVTLQRHFYRNLEVALSAETLRNR